MTIVVTKNRSAMMTTLTFTNKILELEHHALLRAKTGKQNRLIPTLNFLYRLFDKSDTIKKK